jgi:peptidoglycan-associated lipoprotein
MKRATLLSLAVMVAACSTPTPPPATNLPPLQANSTAPAPPPHPQPAPVVQAESPMQTFERMRMALANESVFFEFDQSEVKADQTSALSDEAKLASAYANDHVTLQGNCDERGANEYNLALGQRRADAVKQRLVLLGVPASRIETVSFGKTKPRSLCHDETCWADNRRVDFVHDWK